MAERHRVLPTIFPLSRGRVDDAKQLIIADRLGVEDVGDGFTAQVLEGLLQRGPHPGLSRPGGTQQEHGVTDVKQLLQLDTLCEHKDSDRSS